MIYALLGAAARAFGSTMGARQKATLLVGVYTERGASFRMDALQSR